MSIYRKVDGFMIQRALPFAGPGSVAEGLRQGSIQFPRGEIAGIVARRGAATAFNLTAAFVWDLLDGRRTLDELVDLVLERFRVEPERARADVLGLLTNLESRGFIVNVTSCSPRSPIDVIGN